MKRCRTSILPDNGPEIIQVQGFYWPRHVFSPETRNTKKIKPIKAKRQRKYSFSKERKCIVECLKLLPQTPIHFDLLQSSYSSREEYSCSTPEERQSQHSYAWNPIRRDTLKITQNKSRIVPEKPLQRKALRSMDKKESSKGWLAPNVDLSELSRIDWFILQNAFLRMHMHLLSTIHLHSLSLW